MRNRGLQFFLEDCAPCFSANTSAISISFVWHLCSSWDLRELNPQPTDYESAALTIELRSPRDNLQ